MRSDLDELARELEISERVDFVESLDEPDLYYAASDVLVVPFLDERFSSVHLLEGFAHGLPAIATDLGEQAALLADADAGLRVPPGDEAALAAAMCRLAADASQRIAMGKAAVELAHQHRVEACAGRLAELYAELARCSEPRGAPAPR
jgi:glycosyltransferase involved in cell wall biosynthesis